MRALPILLSSFLASHAHVAAEGKPNIVYIVIDNVTFEHMGKAYGGENVTPAMDSLATEGVRFDRMYVPCPLCVPSRYSILTGRYPERCTSPRFLASNPANEPWYEVGQVELEPDRPNLPKALQAAGYRTGFVGKFHLLHADLGPHIKLENPTHISDPELNRLLPPRNSALAAHIRSCGFHWVGAAQYGNDMGVRNVETDGAHHNLEWHIDHALRFLDESASGKDPFFLYLATQMYHLPFDDEKILLADYEEVGRYTERGLLDHAPRVPMPPRKEIAAIAKADGGNDRTGPPMRYLDFGVKAVLDRIDQLGLKENTLVILLSDNNQAGKSTVYEGGIRVPSAMRWPKSIPAGQHNRRLLSSLDIVATLLDIAGAKEPQDMGLEGKSFLPMITTTPDQPWDDAFLAEYAYGRALVTPRWKYVAVRYPETRWEQIRAEEARNPKEPDFGRNKNALRKWQKHVRPHLHENQIPRAFNIYRFWHSGDNNHSGRHPNYPHIFDLDQLYDLDNDPAEQKNLADRPEHAEVLNGLKAKLAEKIRTMDRPFGEFARQ